MSETMQAAGIVVYTEVEKKIIYLLLLNAKGHWDFPKGKIEEDEDKKTAALRELKEEAGISATIHDGFQYSFSYFFTDFKKQKVDKTVYFFVGRADSTEVKLSEEHTEFAWLSFDEALSKLQYDNQKTLLKDANEFLQVRFC